MMCRWRYVEEGINGIQIPFKISEVEAGEMVQEFIFLTPPQDLIVLPAPVLSRPQCPVIASSQGSLMLAHLMWMFMFFTANLSTGHSRRWWCMGPELSLESRYFLLQTLAGNCQDELHWFHSTTCHYDMLGGSGGLEEKNGVLIRHCFVIYMYKSFQE